MKQKDIIAIIPARGGSKRIPKKNVEKFFGKPMISWTIEAAIETKLFDRIIVSTDDNNIARVSLKHGAEVPFFREKTNDDKSPVSLATLEALMQAEQYFDEKYAVIFQLMANTPLRNKNDIIDQYDFFKERNAESVISCFKTGWINPWWACKIDEYHKPHRLFPKYKGKRSQDLPELYVPTGATWISNTTTLKEYQSFYSPEHLFFPIDWKNAVDIDSYEDLQMAVIIKKYLIDKEILHSELF